MSMNGTEKYGTTTLQSFNKPSEKPEKYLRGRSKTNSESGYIHIDGYPYIRGGNNSDYIPVHRLVAVAKFGVGEVASKHVHHKNGVRWDCRPENLELLTNAEHHKLENRNVPLSERLSQASEEFVSHALSKAGYDKAANVVEDDEN